MNLPIISAPAAAPASDRSRRDERSMRLVESAIALLAIGAATLLSFAR